MPRKSRHDTEKLAGILRHDPAELRKWLSGIPAAYSYVQFKIPKRTPGKWRLIEAPNESLRDLQKKIYKIFLKDAPIQTSATGFIPKRSIMDNAKPHLGSQCIIKIDLKDFFTSISIVSVKKYWSGLGWNERAASILANICCKDGYLPQGAPTSPALSNLVNQIFDGDMFRIARKHHARYTRYADDLTFSFPKKQERAVTRIRPMLDQIRAEIESSGYRIQLDKGIKILRPHQRQIVTGLVVNERLTLPRATRHKIRALRHLRVNERLDDLSLARLEGYENLSNMIDKNEKNPKKKAKETPSIAVHLHGDFVQGDKNVRANNIGAGQSIQLGTNDSGMMPIKDTERMEHNAMKTNSLRSSIKTPSWQPEQPFVPRILIMKGGGIKGIAYAGALEVLEEYGYKFTHFVGTSAGAITAALLAVGYSTAEIKEILGKTDFREFKDRWLISAILLLFWRKGLYKGDKFKEWLEPLLSEKFPALPSVDISFEHVTKYKKKRLTVFASIEGRKYYEFDSKFPRISGGNFSETIAFACRCSMAIPYFFEPERIGGKLAVDGGAQNNYPVYALRDYFTEKQEMPKDFLGLYLGEKRANKSLLSKLILPRILSILTEAKDSEAKETFIDRTIVIYPDPVSTLDFSLTPKEIEFLIAEGRTAALIWLAHWADGKVPTAEDVAKAKKESNSLREVVSRERSKRFWKKLAICTVLLFVILVIVYAAYQYFRPPRIPDSAWAIAIESDSNLEHAKKHLKDLAIANGFKNAYIFYREAETESNRYRTVIIFESEQKANENFPAAKSIKPEITDVKEMSKWCPRSKWNGDYFECGVSELRDKPQADADTAPITDKDGNEDPDSVNAKSDSPDKKRIEADFESLIEKIDSDSQIRQYQEGWLNECRASEVERLKYGAEDILMVVKSIKSDVIQFAPNKELLDETRQKIYRQLNGELVQRERLLNQIIRNKNQGFKKLCPIVAKYEPLLEKTGLLVAEYYDYVKKERPQRQ